jgi:hypothetical protein
MNDTMIKIRWTAYLCLCGEALIDPHMALEQEELVKLIENGGDYEEIRNYLRDNF